MLLNCVARRRRRHRSLSCRLISYTEWRSRNYHVTYAYTERSWLQPPPAIIHHSVTRSWLQLHRKTHYMQLSWSELSWLGWAGTAEPRALNDQEPYLATAIIQPSHARQVWWIVSCRGITVIKPSCCAVQLPGSTPSKQPKSATRLAILLRGMKGKSSLLRAIWFFWTRRNLFQLQEEVLFQN